MLSVTNRIMAVTTNIISTDEHVNKLPIVVDIDLDHNSYKERSICIYFGMCLHSMHKFARLTKQITRLTAGLSDVQLRYLNTFKTYV